MVILSRNDSILHFSHPGHTLTAVDTVNGGQEYRCNGCKIPGTGMRFRCHGCNFDLHEYCATCPPTLSSFMHRNHALTLVTRPPNAPQTPPTICHVCGDPVAGIFYQCRDKDCRRFDVHPLCTQLPQRLCHALHDIHLLSLEFSPTATDSCRVCRGLCDGWRYRCGICRFDIHIRCVLVPVVRCPPPTAAAAQSNQRGGVLMFNGRRAFQAPPQFANYYAYGLPPGPPPVYHFRPPGGFNYNMHPYNGNNGIGGGLGNMMFAIVQQLSVGVISNMIFGVDLFPI